MTIIEQSVIMKASDELSVNDYINCFLADKGVREGFLFQMIDHKEYNIEEPFTKKFLLLVKKYFKGLNHLSFNQGVLLSRKLFEIEDVETSAKLGKILGFPCDIPEYPSKKNRYGYDIVVFIKMPDKQIEELTQLAKEMEYEIPTEFDFSIKHNIISFMSLDATHQTTLTQTEIIKNILLNDESFELRSSVVDVKLVITPIYTESYFIDALLQADYIFTEDELFEISNIWYNHIGEEFLDEFKDYLDDSAQLLNPVNRGIIIGILLFSENNTTQVFYPIQNNGDKLMEEYETIHSKLESRMMETLKRPKTMYKNYISEILGIIEIFPCAFHSGIKMVDGNLVKIPYIEGSSLIPDYTESYFIDALLQADYEFTKTELNKLSTYWVENIGNNYIKEFLELFIKNKILMMNPVNRGIIISMLLFSENNGERVFNLIQNDYIKIEKHKKIKMELEERLIEILNKSFPLSINYLLNNSIDINKTEILNELNLGIVF